MKNFNNNKMILSLIILCFALSFIFMAVVAKTETTNNYDKLKKQNEAHGEKDKKIIKEIFKDNKEKYFKKAEEKKLNDGIYILNKQMTYEEFINDEEINKMFNYTIDLKPCIAKNRIINVIIINYKKGFKHKKGIVENAIIIKYFDAETGEIFGYGIKSLNENGNGIKLPKE